MSTRPTIILVYPKTDYYCTTVLAPLSLVYVASLVKNNFNVVIFDQRVDEKWQQHLINTLKTAHILCVGISTMTGPQIMGGLQAAKVIKEVSPSVPIVWGGIHPSLLPELTIQNELVDIVVIGDGEETFAQLCSALENRDELSSVKGIVFKQDGTIIKTTPAPPFEISRFNLSAYELVDMNKYKSNPAWTERTSLPLITSRGCPYKCGYCYNAQFSHRSWRCLDAEKTVANIAELKDRYKLGAIFLLDDNFFVDLTRVRQVCDLLIEHKFDIRIYNANCRADVLSRMDYDTLKKLKQAGFDRLYIGVESGSDSVLEAIDKEIHPEQVLEVNSRLKEIGIKPFYSFMAGFPFEGRDEVKQTLILMRRLVRENPQAFVYRLQLFTPFPGTKLFDLIKQKGADLPQKLEQWADYHYDRINLKQFDLSYRKFLEDLQFYSMFLDGKLSSGRRGYLLMVSRLYQQLLDFRVRHGWLGAMYELIPLKVGQKIRNRILGRC
jgi:anaerobic magnesium-protoporphyrin IX monomethyl ester cyclase